MKNMTILIQDTVTNTQWTETYKNEKVKTEIEAIERAKYYIDVVWNGNLRSYENPRKFIKLISLEDVQEKIFPVSQCCEKCEYFLSEDEECDITGKPVFEDDGTTCVHFEEKIAFDFSSWKNDKE